MSNDDDMLEAFDLSAWDAPPPPADLADTVIDRMGGTDVAIAMPDETHEPRRAWIIGGVAVAVVALGLGVWSLIRSAHPAAPTSGGVIADKARTLSLDTVHADLDSGADVRWKRDGNVLTVEQRAGTVTWHVDSGEKLVIDAGASLASVEAEGANLRVEVQMNATDARVLGATAAVAAAAALVTVVVYEGHVKVGKSNQTVVVAPGSTYQVKGQGEQQEGPVVGASVGDRVGMPKVAIMGLELVNQPTGDEPVVAQVLTASMRTVAKTEGPYQLAAGSDKELVDEKMLDNCENEAVECMAAIGTNVGTDFLVFGHIEHAGANYTIDVKLLDVAKKQLVRTGQWQMPNGEAQSDGLDVWAKRIYFGITGTIPTACDADLLKEDGVQAVSVGQHALALAKFEASLHCKFNSYVLQLAFMESCASQNDAKAKQFYKQLSVPQQQKFAQMCIRTKTAYIDGEDDDQTAPKVPDGLTNKQFEAAMAKGKSGVIATCGDKAAEGGKVTVVVQVDTRGKVDTTAINAAPNEAVGDCVMSAVRKVKFPATTDGGGYEYVLVFPKRVATTTPPANCDADTLKDRGLALAGAFKHSEALAQFEASLQCKFNSYVLQLAFMEACASSNSAKATQYYKQLSVAQQQKFAQMCIRTNTSYQGGVGVTSTPPPTCDAKALKQDGLDAVTLGQHAMALHKFEESLKCKQDHYVVELAYMEACAASNSTAAKRYYKQLTKDEQAKFSQMCKRTKTAYEGDSDDSSDPFASSGDKGYLHVFSKPPAQVFIDGVDTGLSTPITGKNLPLSPGKHKVTFVIGDDRFTYPVTIQAGGTATMSKDLQ